MPLQTHRAINVPPEMMLGLAIGLEAPLALAAQHGFSPLELDELQGQDWFKQEISRIRTELSTSGKLAEIKAALMADNLAPVVYREACDPDVPLSLKLEVLKYFNKIGNREPKPQAANASGPMFTIKIDLGGGQSVQVIESTVTEVAEDKTPEDVKAATTDDQVEISQTPNTDDAPKLLTELPVPDFDLSVDAVLRDLNAGAPTE